MKQCINCEKEIPEYKDKRQKFCDRSCAATFNNRLHPKRRPERLCSRCSKPLSSGAKLCQGCVNARHLERVQGQPTVNYMLKDSASRAKNSPIRKWARRTLELEGRARKCEKCGFDLVIQVCHIRPIVDFPEDTLMGVVNSAGNLIYLCPNHHAMLDRGLL